MGDRFKEDDKSMNFDGSRSVAHHKRAGTSVYGDTNMETSAPVNSSETL